MYRKHKDHILFLYIFFAASVVFIGSITMLVINLLNANGKDIPQATLVNVFMNEVGKADKIVDYLFQDKADYLIRKTSKNKSGIEIINKSTGKQINIADKDLFANMRYYLLGMRFTKVSTLGFDYI